MCALLDQLTVLHGTDLQAGTDLCTASSKARHDHICAGLLLDVQLCSATNVNVLDTCMGV